MIQTAKDAAMEAALQTANLMVAAALTAPKGSGRDTIEACILTGEDKDRLAQAMRGIGEAYGEAFILRDAANVDASLLVVVIGCKSAPFGLSNCHMCGFDTCADMMAAHTNCVFNVTDLGIAVGSAVAVAADRHMDNRVMYSAGKGALALGCLSEDVRICYGIPLSVGPKNIYFDRGPGAVLL